MTVRSRESSEERFTRLKQGTDDLRLLTRPVESLTGTACSPVELFCGLTGLSSSSPEELQATTVSANIDKALDTGPGTHTPHSH